jgi:CheY-like chemotaxis protein
MKTNTLALIVEDSLRVRRVLEDFVDALGHDFHSVASQHEACRHLNLHTYDYILLDLELPKLSGKPPLAEVGRELLRQIKQHPSNCSAPVLSMSANFGTDSKLGDQMVELGATAWISKPFVDLYLAIKRITSKSHPSR